MKLNALETGQSDFMSIISHELKTPMTAINGFLWMMQERADRLSEDKKKEYIGIMYAESARLIRLVNDLLDITKIEHGRFDLMKAQTRLSPIAAKIAAGLRAQRRDLSVTVDFQDPAPALEVDGDRIEQVLASIAGNAAKHSPAGGEVRIAAAREGDSVVVSVSDQGPGIAPEHQGRLFEKFYRVEGASGRRRKGAKGVGLGLTISKKIIEMHGGRIWVESEPGKGATFYFSLPVKSE